MIRFFRLGTESAEIIRISEPIKSHWAREKGLDLDQLLSDGPYKEKYRKEMIVWSDHVRSTDPGYFCRAAINKSIIFFIVESDFVHSINHFHFHRYKANCNHK